MTGSTEQTGVRVCDHVYRYPGQHSGKATLVEEALPEGIPTQQGHDAPGYTTSQVDASSGKDLECKVSRFAAQD